MREAELHLWGDRRGNKSPQTSHQILHGLNMKSQIVYFLEEEEKNLCDLKLEGENFLKPSTKFPSSKK